MTEERVDKMRIAWAAGFGEAARDTIRLYGERQPDLPPDGCRYPVVTWDSRQRGGQGILVHLAVKDMPHEHVLLLSESWYGYDADEREWRLVGKTGMG